MKVEEIVTQKIIEHLKEGKIPWKKPWTSIVPQNFATKRPYHGINLFLLGVLEYPFPYFVTFKQAMSLKGSVKKGEKGHFVVYWDFFEKVEEDKQGKPKVVTIPFLKYYTVFNVAQCDGIEIPPLAEHQRNENFEEILKTYPNRPELEEGQNRAYYSPSEDKVVLPPLNRFSRVDEYYSAMYHEFTHSTGEKGRLNRFDGNSQFIFGSESYSKEELVAELGSAFLCARYEFDNRCLVNSSAYIQGWITALNNDPQMIVHASGKASRAVNYMLGIKEEKHEETGTNTHVN